MGFSCTLCGLGPRVTVFVIGTITLVFSLLMAGLATVAILTHNCEIDMTDSKETYGLFLFYFRSDKCGPIDLSYLGINNVSVPLGEPDMTAAVHRTFVFAVVSAALHGALAVTTVLLFGTMCVSCLGRSCVVVGFYPWILAMFLVLALDVTGFVVYLIDFINVMDVDGVIDLLEITDHPAIRGYLEDLDDIYLIAPSLFMWLAFSKGVLFWFMFVIFLAVIMSLSMRLWKENKPAPSYGGQVMQPRQVMHPTSPPEDLEDTHPSSTRYFDQAPQQQIQPLPHAHQHHQQRIYPVLPPPNQLQLPHSDSNVRRTVEPLNDAHDSEREESSPPYQPSMTTVEPPNPVPLNVKQTVDPYTDKRFSYLPGQPAPFSYLAGPPPGNSPRSSVNAPPEVRNQLPWSYFPAPDEMRNASKRLTSTLTEEKEFAGEEKQVPTVKVTGFPDDRSSVTTDEGKWSGPEYKY